MKEEMNHGVKIILERLRDFPADFVKAGPYNTVGQYHETSWADLATYITAQKETFTEEERKAVHDAMRVARGLQVDAVVMDLLARPPEQFTDDTELEIQRHLRTKLAKEQHRSMLVGNSISSGVTYSGGVITSGLCK